MKHLLIISFYIFTVFSLIAQPTVFERTYEELGYGQTAEALIITNDGGYAFAGRQDISLGNSRLFLAKTDSLGELIWSQFYGEYTESWAWDLKQTLDGGFIISGRTKGEDVTSSGDAYVIRTDLEGELIWSNLYGYERAEGARSVIVMPDSTYILAGFSRSFSEDNEAWVYLFKIDDQGELIWEKTYVEGKESAAQMAILTEEGDVILAGLAILSGGPSYQGHLLLCDVEGDTLWTRHFGWSNSNELVHGIVERPNGGFLAVGSTSFLTGGSDFYLSVVSSEGDTLWKKIIEAIPNTGEKRFDRIVASGDGNYFLLGNVSNYGDNSNYDPVIHKITPEGEVLWYKLYGGSERDLGESLVATPDGGFAFVGFTQSFCSGCAYFVKTDGEGNITTINTPSPERYHLNLFPNPVHTSAALEMPFVPHSLHLLNASGQMVRSFNTSSKEAILDFTGLTSGSYWLVVEFSPGEAQVVKVIIS